MIFLENDLVSLDLGLESSESLMNLKIVTTESTKNEPKIEQGDNSDPIAFIDGGEVVSLSQEKDIPEKNITEKQVQEEVQKPQEEKEKEQKSKTDFLIASTENPDVFDLPQEIADRIMSLEFAIQERNIQMTEFQEIISSLKERNATLEKEKQEEMTRHAGFRQETIEEAQHLRDIYTRLQEKERHLDNLIAQNTPQDYFSSKQDPNDDAVDWFQECVKASKRLQDLEECMRRQDGLFKEIEAEREILKAEVTKLKELTCEHEKPDPVSFEGVQELLMDIQNVVSKLHRDDAPTKIPPKAIRFYPDTELAVKELQSMKKAKATAVFIVANAFSTAKDFLYKKIGKKKGRKQRRKLKIQNLVDSTGNARNIDHIEEEGSHINFQETHDELKQSSEKHFLVEEPQKEPEFSTFLDGSEFVHAPTNAVPLELEQSAGATEDKNATAQELASDIFNITNVQLKDFTERPRLSQSIKELKTVDVDSLRNVLQRGGSVSTASLKSSSLLLCYRQQLSPVSENEECRGEVKQECQCEEVGEKNL